MKFQKSNLGKISIECMMNPSNNNGLETMKVTSLELKDIGGIPYLKLENINPQMNIICGENGVGKTNILDSISMPFSLTNSNIISKRVGAELGTIKIEHDINSQPPYEIYLDYFSPSSSDHYTNSANYQYNKFLILYLKTNRALNYKKVNSISSDPDPIHRGLRNSSGLDNNDIKDWLLNRILHSGHARHLSESQVKNLDLAKECFSFLNNDYFYSRLDTANEIYLNTPTGEIYFEYLSSGFKSTLYILLGIIKELEYRFQEIHLAAKDYNGIILIDEIELHLHPEWQGKICTILKKVFPQAQFFITTHSPHVVQTARQGEVIALERKDGEVIRRDLPTSEYGYQGWTIEEVLKDVMGMPDLRTNEYEAIRNEFMEAFKRKDKLKAQEVFDKLQEMLHPSNELKVIYQMQLDSLGE